jgi:hypothetical protein
MERQVGLAERRAALVAGYDAEAATCDDEEYPWGMQREWVARVLRLLYLTVHELQPHHIERAFESLSALGQPAVRGELAEPDAPGHHYCQAVTRQWTGSGSRVWRSSTRASGGKTGGAIATSCCAPARLRPQHDTVQ